MLCLLITISNDLKSQIKETLNTWNYIPYKDGSFAYQLHVEADYRG